jgi:hypothetical protein
MSEGIRVNIPDAPAEDGAIELTLPSGRKALMRAPNGTHMIAANKLIKGKPSMTELVLAIISRTTLIDGKAMTFEDFIRLPLGDLFKLQGVMNDRFLGGLDEEEEDEEASQTQP